MLKDIEKLIKKYRNLHPMNTGPLTPEEMNELSQRLYVLAQPHTQLGVSHYQSTEYGDIIKKFVDDEIARIDERLGKDAFLFMKDLTEQLTISNPNLHNELYSKALSELGLEE